MSRIWSVFLISFMVVATSCTKKQDFKTKVLTQTIHAQVKALDPILANDAYSSHETSRVYEGLLEYHYLKRPYVLVPSLAEDMPTVSENGLVYTFKIRKGVFFHDNKCFKGGKGRELKAQDFVYSLMRLADPINASSGWWLLDEKIVGLNEWRNSKNKSYSDAIEGLKALDDYTLQFKLARPYPQFLYALAMSYTFVVPKEAVEFYDKEFLNNPVGTGPFTTGTYAQGTKIVYTKNPNYRDVRYPTEGAPGDKEAGYLKDAGKKVPFLDKVVVIIQTEKQPAWLSFEKGKTDFLKIPKDQFDSVVTPDKKVTDAYAKKGIEMQAIPELTVGYTAFNHEDKLFQGKKGLLLRRAMSLAYDRDKVNDLFYNGRSVKAQTVIPPGIGGYDPNFVNPYNQFNQVKAKELLKEAGYENGKGLPEITLEITSSTLARQMGEFFQKSMAQVGINIKINSNSWPELSRKVKTRKAQMFHMSWVGDYPDGENFLQLLYGPNSSPGPNGVNYNNDEFNKIFEKATILNDHTQRDKLYAELAQKAALDVAHILEVHRTSFIVKHSWLKNYKFTSYEDGSTKFFNIDLEDKKERINKL